MSTYYDSGAVYGAAYYSSGSPTPPAPTKPKTMKKVKLELRNKSDAEEFHEGTRIFWRDRRWGKKVVPGFRPGKL